MIHAISEDGGNLSQGQEAAFVHSQSYAPPAADADLR